MFYTIFRRTVSDGTDVDKGENIKDYSSGVYCLPNSPFLDSCKIDGNLVLNLIAFDKFVVKRKALAAAFRSSYCRLIDKIRLALEGGVKGLPSDGVFYSGSRASRKKRKISRLITEKVIRFYLS